MRKHGVARPRCYLSPPWRVHKYLVTLTAKGCHSFFAERWQYCIFRCLPENWNHNLPSWFMRFLSQTQTSNSMHIFWWTTQHCQSATVMAFGVVFVICGKNYLLRLYVSLLRRKWLKGFGNIQFWSFMLLSIESNRTFLIKSRIRICGGQLIVLYYFIIG